MHKKIESELVSLAHSILQMKNSDDIVKLKEKAGQVYEKLSVLAFVDRYAQSNPEYSKTTLTASLFQEASQSSGIATDKKNTEAVLKEVVAPKPKVAVETESVKATQVSELKITEVEPTIKTTPVKEVGFEELIQEVKDIDPYAEEDLFSRKVDTPITKEVEKSVEKDVAAESTSVSHEFQDILSVEVATDLFEKKERISSSRKTINDTVVQGNLQIGLNDRIAFVKHLFEGSQQDFNRVVSQLNSFKSEKEAIGFVTDMVKLDYDWSGKEAYEDRFISLITRKFA